MLIPPLHSSLRISKNNLLILLMHSSTCCLCKSEQESTHISCCAVFCLLLLPTTKDKRTQWLGCLCLRAEMAARPWGSMVVAVLMGQGCAPLLMQTRRYFLSSLAETTIRAFPVQMNYNLPVCR